MKHSPINKEKKELMLQLIKEGLSLKKISLKTGLGIGTIHYYSVKIRGKTLIPPRTEIELSKREGEIIGIFAGDGSLCYDKKRSGYIVKFGFGKNSESRAYVKHVKRLLKDYFNKEFYLIESPGNIALSKSSKKIFEHFSNFLDFERELKHSTVKLKTLNFPDDFLVGFLKGFLDTDGTICFPKDRKIRIGYFTTSEALATQISQLLCKFKINNFITVGKSSRNYKDLYQVFVNACSIDSFLKLINPFKSLRLGAWYNG